MQKNKSKKKKKESKKIIFKPNDAEFFALRNLPLYKFLEYIYSTYEFLKATVHHRRSAE